MRVLRPVVHPAPRLLPVTSANLLQRGTVGSEFVRHDDLGLTVFPHCFLEEFQRRPPITRLRDEALKNLPFVIDGPPEVMPLAIDLHEDLVEMPTPAARFHPFDPALPDLGGKHGTKPVPPIPHRLVADIDTALVEEIFDIPERQWEADVKHHRKADDFRAAVKAFERVRFGHVQTLRGCPACLNRNPSDNAVRTHHFQL